MRIALVAEDEPTLRRIVCRVLREEGYEVIEAEDGETAVVKFAAAPRRRPLSSGSHNFETREADRTPGRVPRDRVTPISR